MTTTNTSPAPPAPDAAVARAVDDYFASWNETDPGARRAIVERLWTTGGRYVDPLSDVHGPEAIDAMLGGLQASHPGFSVRRTTALDHHHDVVRFGWEILDADGGAYLEGIDVVTVTADGRFDRLEGFFGSSAPEGDR